jgi:sodium-independent sulfate anion transporter 11
LVTVFSSIENGIYTSIVASLALLVLRIMVPRGQFLGKVILKGDQGNKSRVIRQVFLPLDSQTDDKSHIKVTAPAPGVVIYRHEDGLLYPNSSAFNVHLVDYVKKHTRRGKDLSLVPLRDRPWNEPGPKRGAKIDEANQDRKKPLIRAIVLDFSSV